MSLRGPSSSAGPTPSRYRQAGIRPCSRAGFCNRRIRCRGQAHTRLFKLLHKLGIAAWPKIFHNLRASRQTELEECFPSHVVCRWMGNSETVARDHYLQTTEEHFLAGSTMATESPSEKAARKAARKTPEGEGKARNRNIRNAENPTTSRVFHKSTGADGNRTTVTFRPKMANSRQGGVKSGALDKDICQDDDDGPARLVVAWHSLPDDVKAEIMRLAVLSARE